MYFNIYTNFSLFFLIVCILGFGSFWIDGDYTAMLAAGIFILPYAWLVLWFSERLVDVHNRELWNAENDASYELPAHLKGLFRYRQWRLSLQPSSALSRFLP